MLFLHIKVSYVFLKILILAWENISNLREGILPIWLGSGKNLYITLKVSFV